MQGKKNQQNFNRDTNYFWSDTLRKPKMSNLFQEFKLFYKSQKNPEADKQKEYISDMCWCWNVWMFKVLEDILRRDHLFLLWMPTLSFEEVDVYQVNVINKYLIRLLMGPSLAGPKTFDAVVTLYFLNGFVTTQKQLKKITLSVFYFEE